MLSHFNPLELIFDITISLIWAKAEDKINGDNDY